MKGVSFRPLTTYVREARRRGSAQGYELLGVGLEVRPRATGTVQGAGDQVRRVGEIARWKAQADLAAMRTAEFVFQV